MRNRWLSVRRELRCINVNTFGISIGNMRRRGGRVVGDRSDGSIRVSGYLRSEEWDLWVELNGIVY